MRRPNACGFERSNGSAAILVATFVLGLLASPGTGYSLAPVRENLPAPNGEVRAMARANGTIYLGGEFSVVGPVAGPACAFDLVTAVVQTPSLRLLGHVNCTAPDGNGGWFLGGSFSSVQGQPRQNLAHIDPSGAVTSWNPGTDGIVQDIAVAGGVVYAVGPFTTVGGAARDNVAAIDAVTGAVTHWNPVQDGTSVFCVEMGGGKVYLAGNFTTMSGQARQCLAEFTAVVPGDLSTGILTGAFSAPDTLTSVQTLKLEGGMLFYDDLTGSAGDNLFVRDLTADTLLYVLPANGYISDFAFDQTNGTFFVCGSFTTIGGVARSRLAAIDIATGSVIPWSVGADAFVQALSLAHVNGVEELFVGGDFTSLGGVPRRGVGVVDPLAPAVMSWNAACDGNVDVVEVDGTKVFVTGDFRIVNGVPRSNLAAIDETSGAILNWSPTTNGAVHALAISGSTLYAGGGFTRVNGTTRNHAAGVDAATGALTAFSPNADDTVRAIAVASDGSTIYLGGDFSLIRGIDRASLVAVNPTSGVPLPSWTPYTDGIVNALLFLPGGIGSPVVVAGGAFSFANGVTRHNFVSMDAQTGATMSLDPSPNGPVRALAFVPTDFGGFNQLYLGGDFTSVAGQPRNHIAMLIAFGALASWDPNASRPVYSILQVGNTVFVGGDFDFIGGQQRAGLAAIDVNGAATAWDSGIFRFTLPAFVNSLLENGGILYAGGQFPIEGSGRPNFAGFYDMVTAVADEPASEVTPLAVRVAPNPFDQSTRIRFSLPEDGEARVTVYDVAGRRTREIHKGWLPSGRHTMPWDGRDDSGRPVATGIYFVDVKTQAGSMGSKVFRVK